MKLYKEYEEGLTNLAKIFAQLLETVCIQKKNQFC